MPHVHPPPPNGASHPLVRRAEVAEAAVREFAGKPFVWGERDCVRMAAWVLKRLGHKVSLAGIGKYANEAGALRALKRKGFDRLDAAIDAQGLIRIPPAMRLPCDLIGLKPAGDERWIALGVALSTDRILLFVDDRCRVATRVQTQGVLTAWRTL